jgi:RoxA-like, cytochrome c-like
MATRTKWRVFRILLLLLGLVFLAGWFTWCKMFRTEPEQQWASEEERFKYGSIGAEFSHGIPYWIWEVLPRVFSDLLPGAGGYKSFGLVWEEGKEMPVGFTKQVIGYPRVGINCALCHVGTWRSQDQDVPHVVVGAPANTVQVEALFRFLARAGGDSRFNATTLLAEIKRDTKLSCFDCLMYRLVFVPRTRRALEGLNGLNRAAWPHCGRGQGNYINLTEDFLSSLPQEEAGAQADFPSIWNLQARKGPNRLLYWGGEGPSAQPVLMDSSLGIGAAPRPRCPTDSLHWSLGGRRQLIKRVGELDNFLSALPPPKYPFAVDQDLASKGKLVFDHSCADCHSSGGARTCQVIPISEIGTDTNRMAAWTRVGAEGMNAAVKNLGITRADLIQNSGYCSPLLDGIWIRGPFLHNGSVPTLVDLLKPVHQRPTQFYRGFDVYDPVNVGFVSQGPQAEREGSPVNVNDRGNGNQGHTYGADLPATDKQALVEFLKTL